MIEVYEERDLGRNGADDPEALGVDQQQGGMTLFGVSPDRFANLEGIHIRQPQQGEAFNILLARHHRTVYEVAGGRIRTAAHQGSGAVELGGSVRGEPQ